MGLAFVFIAFRCTVCVSLYSECNRKKNYISYGLVIWEIKINVKK
jgi:hypothetical protein